VSGFVRNDVTLAIDFAEFSFGLARILDGIEALIAARASATRVPER
jgi:hypothetical protein